MKILFSIVLGFCYLFINAQQPQKNIFVCGYGESNLTVDICDIFKVSPLLVDKQAEDAVDKILEPLGLPHNFVLVSCPNIRNAIALTPNDGIRYIVYDKEFINGIYNQNSKWYSLSILAHEIGHHLCGHTLLQSKDLVEQKKKEIEADEFSGFVLKKLGATLQEAQLAALKNSSNNDDVNSTHPSLSKRLWAIEKGYLKASAGIIIDNVNNIETVEAMFQRARTLHLKGLSKEAVILYDQILSIDDKFYRAYYNRAYFKEENKDYLGAIEDYTLSINSRPNSEGYNNRGNTLMKFQRYSEALSDFNLAILLDPSNDKAWSNRANLKAVLEDLEGAYNDYKKLILLSNDNLDKSEAYQFIGWYYRNSGNGDYTLDCYNKAISLNSKNSKAYYYRGCLYGKRGFAQAACEDLNHSCYLGNSNACSLLNKTCK